MDISIIIVSWNVRDLLKRCLTSIFKHSQGISFEVLVVDNASADGTADMVAREFPQVTLLVQRENLGFAKANNIGLAQSQGTHVFFLNPDTEIFENSIKILFDILESNPVVALVGPRLVYPDTATQPSVKRDPTVCDQVIIALKLHHTVKPRCLTRYLAKDFDYGKEEQVQQLMGAAIAARGSVIRRMGGWNERYFIWWEDVDLCARVRAAGHTVLYTPLTTVIHHEGKSFVQQRSFSKQRRFMRGMRTYFKLHRPIWEYLIISLITPLSLVLALAAQLLRIKPQTQSRV